ncbi:MAG: sigma-54 interaction domain-containing protein [Saccharospirillum sp.]
MAKYGGELVGNHHSIRELRRLVERVAKSPTRTVLIYGETGTGKGQVARLVHELSDRAAHQFMDINCAAIPANLLESELFGHEKGAFTGAADRKIGLVEAANRGTVFLDEIREIELTTQAKLLSLLDTLHFRRVGSVKSTEVDVRFIATTNKILLSEVSAGHFREDLYYRLQVVSINIPPLRERGDDVLMLAHHFIDKFNVLYQREIDGIEPEARDMFLKYPWPGNVRELENLIERIFILEDDNQILVRHLPDRILRTVRSGARSVPPAEQGARDELGQGFHEATAAFQRQLIERALNRCDNNLQETASLLNISRHSLRHQMIKLGLISA